MKSVEVKLGHDRKRKRHFFESCSICFAFAYWTMRLISVKLWSSLLEPVKMQPLGI